MYEQVLIQLISEGYLLSGLVVIVVIMLVVWFIRTGWPDLIKKWDQQRQDRMTLQERELENWRLMIKSLDAQSKALSRNAIELARIESRLGVVVASIERLYRLMANGNSDSG